MSNENNIELYGVKEDGTHVFIGHAATTPPEIKRREIVGNYFEKPHGDDCSDANCCLWALEEYHKWLVSMGWSGPKMQIIPPSVDPRAASDVLSERRRQVVEEGWTPDQDDAYKNGELSDAAASYALNAGVPMRGLRPPYWPWDKQWWKPTDPRRDLVKAGALILAEIERLDRLQSAKNGGGNAVPTATPD